MPLITLVTDKVYLIAVPSLPAIGIADSYRNNTYIYIKPPYTQLVVYDVFHHMGLFKLSEVKPCISQSYQAGKYFSE